MKSRIEDIRMRILHAAEASGRAPDSVRLVAVSKTVPADKVCEATAEGLDTFGENYIQEARDKIAIVAQTCRSREVSWHFIGHLQTNKAKYAVRCFDLIHSVGSIKLAREINKHAEKNRKIQNILIQVNAGREQSKSGALLEEVEEIFFEIKELKHIFIKGLMVIPPFFDNPDKARPYFRELRELRDRLCRNLSREEIHGGVMQDLSMGMTGDFEAAVSEGATIVRIGTAIFGSRY